MANNTRYIIVTKGEPLRQVFGKFCTWPHDTILADSMSKNLAGIANGTQVGCVVHEFDVPYNCSVPWRSKGYKVDYKLVRDFNLWDKICFFGLKQALGLKLMGAKAK